MDLRRLSGLYHSPLIEASGVHTAKGRKEGVWVCMRLCMCACVCVCACMRVRTCLSRAHRLAVVCHKVANSLRRKCFNLMDYHDEEVELCLTMHQNSINIVSREHITSKVEIQGRGTGFPKKTQAGLFPRTIVDIQCAHAKRSRVGKHMSVEVRLSCWIQVKELHYTYRSMTIKHVGGTKLHT